MPPPEFHYVAGAIVFVMAFCGVISNGGVILLSRQARMFKTGVGKLIRCEAFGALLYCFVFLFYVSPALFFNLIQWQDKSISARFGHVAIFSHDVCLFSHTCISFNRFVAAYFPNRYSTMFSQGKVQIMVWTIPIAAALATFVHYFEPCWLFMLWSGGFFVYESQGCGLTLSLYIQFPRNMALICICSAVDLASLAKLRSINTEARKNNVADSEWQRRHRIEVALIKQVCVQALMYIIEFLTYFIISSHYSDAYLVFLLTTFSWQAIHTTDGLVVFIFNREMRRMLNQALRASQVSTIQVAGSSGGRGSSR